jgi:hypothetical protein
MNKKYVLIKYNMCENMVVKVEAFDVKARKKVVIENPEIVTLKNGRLAARGKSPLTGITVYKILSKKEAEELQKKKK